MKATSAAAVELTIPMPGQWLSASLDDEQAIRALLDHGDRDDLDSLLRTAREEGALLVAVRLRERPLAVLVASWSPVTFAELPGEDVEREHPWVARRLMGSTALTDQDRATYAVASTEAGRVLVLDFLTSDGRFDDLDLRGFLGVARTAGWVERRA